jgi:hypothetical protein
MAQYSPGAHISAWTHLAHASGWLDIQPTYREGAKDWNEYDLSRAIELIRDRKR